jgi:hypothetical protein
MRDTHILDQNDKAINDTFQIAFTEELKFIDHKNNHIISPVRDSMA